MKLRKLTSALVAAGALSSPWALGLGLGDIQLKSALNQPLQAEIKLLQTRELAKEEILPSLADEAEFERAGVERFFFLNDIDFDVELSGSGDGTLLLSTKQSVQEPFLNFLVEINWPNGRVLREYTVLLDPPVYEDLAAEVVVTPQTSEPAKAMVQAEQSKAARNNSQAVVTPVAQSDSRVSDGTYGPVKSTDTLWDIAIAVRPNRSVTVQQTMMSLHELNPNAFVAGNINKIKKGAVLRVPTLDQIQNWKQGSAVQEVAEHNQRYKQSITPDSDNQVQLSGVDQSLQSNVVSPDEARLKIVRSEESAAAIGAASGDQGGNGAELETLENELAITQENLDKANRENEKLAARLQALEDQMSKLSRLVTLKDTQMAELQMTMSDEGEEIESAPVDDSTADMAEEVPPMVNEPTEVAENQAEEVESELAGQEIAPSGVEESIESASSEMTEMEEPVVEPEDVMAEAEPSALVNKPVIKLDDPSQSMQSKTDQSLMDKVLGNPIWLIGLGAGSLLFVILLFMMSRRSYQRESELTDVIEQTNVKDKPSSQVADEELESIDQELDNLDLETQGFGQVSLDGDDALEPDDIVARADSFIAYGQFDNAVGLLEEAINKESGRIDLRLKMLEVYAEMQDTQGFERQKQEILDLGADDVIGQINVLEQKLPGSIGDSASVNAFDSGESLVADESVLDDADFDLSGDNDSDEFSYSLEDLESELASDLSGETAQAETTTETSSDDIDFNLDEELGINQDAPGLDEDVQESNDFSLDMEFDVADDQSAPAATEDQLDSLDELEMPEFESELDSVAGDSEEGVLEVELDSDGELNSGLELDGAADDLSLDDVPAVEDNVLGGSLDASTDDFSLDAELDEVSSLGEDLVQEDSLEQSGNEETAEGDLDIGADLEDLAKSLGVDSADEVDLDAELATASGMPAEEASEKSSDLPAEESSEVSEELEAEEFALDTVDEVVSEEVDTVDDSLESIDTDELSLDGLESEDVVETETADLDTSDVELDSLSLDGVEEAAEEVVSQESDVETGASSADEVVKSNLDEDELDFYVGTDEVATKLDLARAYVDMGDADGARDILEEVIVEGNEDQKTEATDLLNGLS